MIRYQVRSKELIDLVNEIKSKRLIISPFFQRNLVWRELHKVDFIKTILMGLPFPQIFIAKGSIDLETMTTTSCIVDGQQRMSTIVEYVSSKLYVDGKLFNELAPEIRESVLKYQVPIIDLDINNEDPEIKEVFKRLNRTFYSLNTIEKLSTEYASSEFMLFAKHLTDEISFDEDDDTSHLSVDPTIPKDFIEWAKQNQVVYFRKLFVEGNIFTPYEIKRQIPLMYALNLIATKIGGFYARNELAARYLDQYKEGLDEKNEILATFEKTAKFIIDMNFERGSYWLNKANMFSLFAYLANNEKYLTDQNVSLIKKTFIESEKTVPEDYQFAAKEAVNNRQERLLRNAYIEFIVESSLKQQLT
jgi:Protein of unknown function DUF262